MAAQASTGGLRDKPSKNADAYHTLYNLAGLSSAQHRFLPSASLLQSLRDQYNASTAADSGSNVALGASGARDEEMRKTIWTELSSWVEDEHQPEARFVGGKANRLVRRCAARSPLLTPPAERRPSDSDVDNDSLARDTEPFLRPERHRVRLRMTFVRLMLSYLLLSDSFTRRAL